MAFGVKSFVTGKILPATVSDTAMQSQSQALQQVCGVTAAPVVVDRTFQQLLSTSHSVVACDIKERLSE